MGAATIGLGLALTALGAIGYFASGRESWTALIPAFFGIALAICGGAALKWRKPGVLAAMIVAALGLAGTLSRLLPALTAGEALPVRLATAVQFVMALALGLFLAVGARWLWRLQKGYGEQRRTSVPPGSDQQ